MNYIQNIKTLRIERKVTQTELATHLKIEQTQYSEYEREIHELPIRYLIEIIKYLKGDANEILGIYPHERDPKSEN